MINITKNGFNISNQCAFDTPIIYTSNSNACESPVITITNGDFNDEIIDLWIDEIDNNLYYEYKSRFWCHNNPEFVKIEPEIIIDSYINNNKEIDLDIFGNNFIDYKIKDT